MRSSSRPLPAATLAVALLALLVGGACGGESPAPVAADPAASATAPAPPASTEPPAPPEEDAAAPPPPAPALPCLEDLTKRGVPFTKATARGLVDAVTVPAPINGVTFTTDATDKPTTQPMACDFVRTLWAFADVLKAKGVRKVGTLGSYCYRCCCAWSETNFCRGPSDPEPNCGTNGYSNHSFGRAVDVRYLTMDDGRVFDINKDADFKATPGGTCTGAKGSQVGTSKFLYDLVCEVADKKIFSTILTPNYNSDHRNHWHMDTGQSGTPKGTTVRSLESAGVDVGEHPDACGE
ncbi:MAG TPA: extensin family protein [Polyangiaceae bacterium]|nr:extensin family protein [Polyangiaceae bacterium]